MKLCLLAPHKCCCPLAQEVAGAGSDCAWLWLHARLGITMGKQTPDVIYYHLRRRHRIRQPLQW